MADQGFGRDCSPAGLGGSADYARQQINDEGGPEACIKPFSPATDIAGPYQSKGNDGDEWGHTYARYSDLIMAGDDTVFAHDMTEPP